MNMEELKQAIEAQTGIPAKLLNGETIEETIAQAKALLVYKREHEAERPRTTAEQFAQWMNAQEIAEEAPEGSAALEAIAEQARAAAGYYPTLTDAGEVASMPDPRTPKEQFAQWAADLMAFDPRMHRGNM